MKIARELERRLEGVLDGLAGRIFRGGLHPSEMAARIAREAELAEFETRAGPGTANHFELRINPANIVDDHIAKLASELAVAFASSAADRGWRLEGPVEVVVKTDPDVTAGSVRCLATVVEGELAPWGFLSGDLRLALKPNRALIGRGTDCDVLINAPEVSRHHALLFRQDGQAYVVDLGSANGTFIDGSRLGQTPAKLDEGSVLSLANIDLHLTHVSRLAPRGFR